jgi:hypothetical protein
MIQGISLLVRYLFIARRMSVTWRSNHLKFFMLSTGSIFSKLAWILTSSRIMHLQHCKSVLQPERIAVNVQGLERKNFVLKCLTNPEQQNG